MCGKWDWVIERDVELFQSLREDLEQSQSDLMNYKYLQVSVLQKMELENYEVFRISTA